MRINQSNGLGPIQETITETKESSTSPAINERKDIFESKASSITGEFARPRFLDADAEELKSLRDEYKSKFQEADKKEQEAQKALIELTKSVNDLRLSNIKI